MLAARHDARNRRCAGLGVDHQMQLGASLSVIRPHRWVVILKRIRQPDQRAINEKDTGERSKREAHACAAVAKFLKSSFSELFHQLSQRGGEPVLKCG